MDQTKNDEFPEYDQKAIIAEREIKWDKFFDKFSAPAFMEEEDIDWDVQERVNAENFAAEEGIDDSDNEASYTDGNGNAMDYDSGTECIEVSDNEECMVGFVAAFKQIAQETIQVIEKSHEEHYAEDYKDGDASKSVRRKTITHEKQMISTPKHMANRISKIGNTLKANNENDMALVKATQSSSSLEPYRHDTFINQQTQSNILEKTGAKIVQQVTTTTTTTTTTTIIKHQNDEDVRTPKKDGKRKNVPKSSKKSRLEDEFDFNNEFEPFSTPTSNRRNTRISKSATKLNSSMSNQLCIPLTPLGKSNTVTRKQIQSQIDQIIDEEDIDEEICQSVLRNIRVEKNKQLSLMYTPQKKAITAGPNQTIDPMAMLRANQRPILVKTSECDSS